MRYLFAVVLCAFLSPPVHAFERGDMVTFHFFCKDLGAAVTIAKAHDEDDGALEKTIITFVRREMCGFSQAPITAIIGDRLFTRKNQGDIEVWNIQGAQEFYALFPREEKDPV